MYLDINLYNPIEFQRHRKSQGHMFFCVHDAGATRTDST